MTEILYLCDGMACGTEKPISCWKNELPDGVTVLPLCRRTRKIEHALNFENFEDHGEKYYEEKLSVIEEEDK